MVSKMSSFKDLPLLAVTALALAGTPQAARSGGLCYYSCGQVYENWIAMCEHFYFPPAYTFCLDVGEESYESCISHCAS